jgi:hypothetical protein
MADQNFHGKEIHPQYIFRSLFEKNQLQKVNICFVTKLRALKIDVKNKQILSNCIHIKLTNCFKFHNKLHL